MKRMVQIIVVLSIVASLLLIPVQAVGGSNEIRDFDGTLILDVYPDMEGTAEKDAAAEAYMKYRNGQISLSEVKRAYTEFYIAVRDFSSVAKVNYVNGRGIIW